MAMDGSAARVSLEDVLAEAESAARTATDALLDDIRPTDDRSDMLVSVLRDYCHQAADPFEALGIARLYRDLVRDMELPGSRFRDATEWARTAARLQHQASHLARLLREQGSYAVEQVVVEISIMHLRFVEESPIYTSVLSEMAEFLDSRSPVRPLSMITDLHRRRWRVPHLPTRPPAEGA